MKREIKFRAWDKERQEMLFEGLDFHLRILNYKEDVFKHSSHIGFGELENKIFEIMQFTGLHDKNGKEIYEGDILKRIDVHSETIQTVQFSDGCFYALNRIRPKGNAWLSDNGKSYQLSFILSLNKDWEIIGNIYENPELINK